MLIVIASELDEVAEREVTSWPRGEAVLMRPQDLCSRGWHVEVGHSDEATFVAHGQSLPASSVRGVVNLLPFINERELVTIEPGDRRYVAAELTAFLFFVLSEMRCPMVNRPTINNLAGCDWRMQEWIACGRRCGIPLIDYRERDVAIEARDIKRISVLDGDVLHSDANLDPACAVELIAHAGLVFAELCYVEDDCGLVLQSVSMTPDLSSPAIRSGVQKFFRTH
ncbi:MAG TPA: hypothetical protein VJS12_04680 [Steroidobacteraceae bacterium]|nr:hypothetical protein [Steroidobacteraceae bacterium]